MKVLPPAEPFAGARRIDGRFVNHSGEERAGGEVWRWFRTREPKIWPPIVNPPAQKPLPRVSDGIRITPMGHATVLIQVAGLNILTDPHWSDRAGPTSWLGARRLCPPPVALDDLPPVDVVLLSHGHYDHLDRPTLAALKRRDGPRLVTGLNVGAVTRYDAIAELDWWQSAPLAGDVTATYVPAEHASARGPFDRNKSLWGGFVIQTPAGTVYFAGDTGDGDHFAAIRERFGPPDVSLLPIGAYLPRWFMKPVHLDPHEAVRAATTLQSRLSLPIHYGVFNLADDGYDEPLDGLRAALAERSDVEFRIPTFGEAVQI